LGARVYGHLPPPGAPLIESQSGKNYGKKMDKFESPRCFFDGEVEELLGKKMTADKCAYVL
jgi:hypothetical protein